MMTKEEYEKRLDELDEQVHEAWEKSFEIEGGWKKAWEFYSNHPAVREREKLWREYKLIKDYTLHDFSSLDKECLMPFNEFVECCKVGPLFCDSDGFGYYATKTQVSDIVISPSDIVSGVYRKDFTHVCWYNK